ncbi:MAG: hypothetical protein AAB339_01360, partial [Elusimicrobiota bacterium]
MDASTPTAGLSADQGMIARPEGFLVLAPTVTLTIVAEDPLIAQARSGLLQVEFTLDGSSLPAAFSPGDAQASTQALLSAGLHSVGVLARDRTGHAVERSWSVAVGDTLPPVTTLAVGPPKANLGSALWVSAKTEFSLPAVDYAESGYPSGLRETRYRVIDSTQIQSDFQIYSGTFSLGDIDGLKTIEFFSRDNADNVEVARFSEVFLDASAPVLALLSPSTGSQGICSVFQGSIPVLGSILEDHPGTWRLEWAAGRDASSGFALVSSGTGLFSGTLGIWDTAGLYGWHTLRLSASDIVENSAELRSSVYIGSPALLLSLGDKRSLDKPSGVAAGADGRSYVADTNADRIRVFGPEGAVLATFGGRRDRSDVRFNKPKDVTVDAGGNIWIADTNNHRIVKLSPQGEHIQELGSVRVKRGVRKFNPGSGPGEFRHPSGVALGPGEAIFVSDTGNRRVQVFGADGGFIRQFRLPPVQAGQDGPEDDRDEDDADSDGESLPLGKPLGIDVDSAGMVYVADGFGRRALVYAPDGNLVRELGGGRLKSPYGIAVSTDGSCIFVSDRRSDKIFRFDALGNPLLAFDERLRNPSGLALDALGHLLVADRNNDRIAVFGLPVGVTLASSKVGTRAASAAGAPGNVGTAGPAAQSAGLQAQGAFAEARLGEEGGVLTMAGLGGALIPKGALDEDFDLSVFAPEGSDPQAEKKRLERETLGLGAASDEAAYGPHGLLFDKPVTLVLPFDKGLLVKEKLKVSDLKAYYWDEKAKNWAALASVVDEKAGVVRAQTGHFSIYQVMGVSGAGSEAAAEEADTAFAFRDL